MRLTKKQIRLLGFVHFFRSASCRIVRLFFGEEELKILVDCNLLIHDYEIPCDSNGFYIDPRLPDHVRVYLSRCGLIELEDRQWFDLRYFVTNIIVPILVGAASSIITTTLLRSL